VDPDPKEGYRVVDVSTIRRDGPAKAIKGSTDKKRRVMAIPLTPDGEYVGRHEMGHAKWSPVDKPRSRTWLMRGCLAVCEEMRVNTGLRILDIPVEFPVKEVGKMKVGLHDSLIDGKIVEAGLKLVAARGTNAGDEMEDMIERFAKDRDPFAIALRTIVKGLDKRMERTRKNRPVPTFKQLHRIARWMEKVLRQSCRPDDKPDSQAQRAIRVIGSGFGKRITMKDAMRGSWRQPGYGKIHGYHGGGSSGTRRYDPKMSPFYGEGWGSVPPGDMAVQTPKLTIPLVPPELERAIKARSAEEGVQFRYIERFVSDQRVFKRRAKKRKGGGSVLIDTSGSMSLSDEDVKQIVKDAPEATLIATYSGAEREGTLRVVVNKGKMLDGQFATPGGSNVIDLPALEWLSIQPEPRVWLSDGYVTGINDDCNSKINRACDTIMRDNNITRCEEVEDVCKSLKRDDDVGYAGAVPLDSY
jgi:hypothetical protein